MKGGIPSFEWLPLRMHRSDEGAEGQSSKVYTAVAILIPFAKTSSAAWSSAAGQTRIIGGVRPLPDAH